MKIKQLHYFMAIAQYLNYKTASEAADVSPSLLSQQMVSLEEELGVQLFIRDSKAVSLTASGEVLKKAVPELEKLLAETISIIHKMQEDGENKNVLHVGYEDFFGRGIILAFDSLLKENVQNVHFLFNQYASKDMFDALENGEIDFCFAVLPSDIISDKYEIRLIKEDEPALVVRKELYEKYCGESALNIANHKPMLCYMYNSFGNEIVSSICRQYGVIPKVKLCSTIDEMMTYVDAGMGFAILPRIYIEGRIDNAITTIKKLDKNSVSRLCLTLIYNRENLLSKVPEFEQAISKVNFKELGCDTCNLVFCSKNSFRKNLPGTYK